MAKPINEILREVTRKFLDNLDKNDPPPPRVIEKELLDTINAAIVVENNSRTMVWRERTGGSRSNPPADELLPLAKRLTNSQIVDILLELHHIVRIKPSDNATDESYDILAVYNPTGPDEGIYTSNDSDFRVLATSYNYALTLRDFEDLMSILYTNTPRVTTCSDRDLIAVNNGVFNYRTKELQPFDPKLVFVSKSRVNYVENPENPVLSNPYDDTLWDVESWVREISDDEGIAKLLWQIMSAIVRPRVRWNKAAWLYSEEGNNGKGTLVALMRNLCGEGSWTSIPISAFSQDFLLEPLTRASAILVDENDVGAYIDRAANLKAVITNDVLLINRKYKKPIAYQFWGFMVQCINERPLVRDKSESFYRRQLFIPFSKSFTGCERQYIKDDFIRRPEVLEYVLHKVLNSDFYSFDTPRSAEKALNEYKIQNDPVRLFWSEFKDEFTWSFLPNSFLYDLYVAWHRKDNPSGSPVSKRKCILQLNRIMHNEETEWVSWPSQLLFSTHLTEHEHLAVDYNLPTWTNSVGSSRGTRLVGLPRYPENRDRGLLRLDVAKELAKDNGIDLDDL